ncbi:odorant receptor 67a-like [Odontomachus brunneus]|uniref:odorant receptor 67a-like n=1 Tax=Odontomachus brunneus TaxID=486640 RepID=UPI0013F1BDA4|nr:odorant receptor 67a-like [Odontomachus brunneus]
MDFRNLNPLNVHANYLSGNLLPLKSGDSRLSIGWKLYGVLMWLIQVMQISVLIPGIVMVPWKKTLMDGTTTAVVIIEAFFMVGRIYTHRELANRLIRKLNDLLRVEDEAMRSVVTTTLKPMEIPLKFYWMAGGLSVLLWCCIPFLLLLKKVSFRYEDYRIPATFSKQPFSTEVFLLGSIFLLISNMYIFLKKGGVDIYMIHMVMMITAQYRYIAKKLAAIFRDANLRNELEEWLPEVNRWAEKEIRALCRHHVAVLRISSILKKLLSLSFSMIYVNSVLRFCFIGVMFSAALTTTFLDGFPIAMFICGSIVQFYILCSSVQQLQDASKNITDEAFHEQWYRFGPSVKRTFMLMIQGCNIECKISTNDKFNLSLPSFMAILNQSYSIAILLL